MSMIMDDDFDANSITVDDDSSSEDDLANANEQAPQELVLPWTPGPSNDSHGAAAPQVIVLGPPTPGSGALSTNNENDICSGGSSYQLQSKVAMRVEPLPEDPRRTYRGLWRSKVLLRKFTWLGLPTLLVIFAIAIATLLVGSKRGSDDPVASSQTVFAGEQEFDGPTTPLPSTFPSQIPSDTPSMLPSEQPTSLPSDVPSTLPTSIPSFVPSNFPTTEPTYYPTFAPTTEESRITTFYAIGDVPYDDQQAEELRVQMRNIPKDAEFVIHVGDLRNADINHRECKYREYKNAADILRLSHVPVFVIPGDNDILDCENLDEGLEFWRDEFQGFDSRHWDHDFELQRQPGREENFSFVHKNTLFIALNMVSGENLRSWFSWSERLDDQFRWTRRLIRRYSKTKTDVGRIVIFAHANPTGFHDEFFDPLRRFVIDELENSIPMLYLNGDGHEWYYEPSFLDQKSLLRIMVTGGTTEPPLKVTVNANGKNLKPSRAYKHDRRLD